MELFSLGVRKGWVKNIGSQPLRPTTPVPKRLRLIRGCTSTGAITMWAIEDGESVTLRKSEELSDEERQLPIAAIWGHDVLVHRLITGWRPECEVTHRTRDLERFCGKSGLHRSPVVRHYVYFPEESVGRCVADLLRQRGHEVEDRFGADGLNWLVLVKTTASGSSTPEVVAAEMREMLNKLAAEYGGEYDGWEIELAN